VKKNSNNFDRRAKRLAGTAHEDGGTSLLRDL
jgi:hypothetical protein